jgi:hemolysin III
MRTMPPEPSSPFVAEEIANTVTHGVGAVLSLGGLVVLVVLASLHGTALHIASVAVYGVTLVLAYLASTLFHAARDARAKELLNLLDHAAIFLLIAGTYTPFSLISLGGVLGWTLFVVIWALAVAGVLFKVFHRRHGRGVSVTFYLAMGWLVIVTGGEMWGALGPGGTFWVVVGGIAYTAGTAFYIWERLPFNHALWHLFVLAGSGCHFAAIVFHVLPAAG